MCVVIWLSAVRSVVLSTRFQYSVKAFKVIINMNSIKTGDVKGNKAVLANIDIILDYLVFY